MGALQSLFFSYLLADFTELILSKMYCSILIVTPALDDLITSPPKTFGTYFFQWLSFEDIPGFCGDIRTVSLMFTNPSRIV